MNGQSGARAGIWQTALALACLLAACAVASSTAAAKGVPAGRLDPSFGKGGKVTVGFPAGNTGSVGPQYELPFSFAPGHLEMAQAPGGKTVVAGATKIVRFLANGKLDKSFGSGGVVTVPRPVGAVFVLASAAVDSAGRIVLAGVRRPVPTNSTPDPVLSSATVMRFNADGSPDTGFGSGGTLVTNFNLPAPKAAGGRYPGASVGIANLAIDPQNRILITGGVVTELSCTRSVNSEGFVTRLTESGAVDPSFGFHLVEGLARVGQIEPRPGGFLALASGGPLCSGEEGPSSVMIGIDPNGNVDSGFGSFGFRTLDFAFPPAMAVTPTGKILLMDNEPYKISIGKGKKKHRVRVQTIEQLLPSGAADPSFRRIGRVNVFLPKHGSLSTLAVDSSGRIVVAGRLTKRISKSPKNKLRRSLFLVSRLNADGSTDRTFGNHGSLTTAFGGPTDSFATEALTAGGRILVGGGISGPKFGSGGGYAIARYLGDPQGKKRR
ncbi:MAG TPA: hypothetical protein VIH47_09675 [Solirubrobacterales bacterium]